MKILRRTGPAVSFLGKIAGIAVTLLVVRMVGVGPETTPLFLALALVTFVSSVLVSLIEVQAVAELGAHRNTSARSVLGGALLLGCAAVVITGTALIFFASFSALAARILPFALPLVATLPLTTLFAGYVGVGISREKWFSPAIASGCRTLLVVALLVALLPRHGLPVVPVALVLGEVMRLAFVASVFRVEGAIEYRAVLRYIRRVLVQVPSSLFGSANPAVDRYVVGILGLGSVAILDLAEKAYMFVALAFTQGILPPLYRGWSLSAERQERNRMMYRACAIVFVVAIAVAVLAVFAISLGAPFVLGSKAQAYGPTLAIASAAYLLGLAPYLAGQILVRLIVLENRMHWLNYTAAIQLTLNVVLDLVLGPRFGLVGIALATSSVAWLGFGLFVWLSARISREGRATPAPPSYRGSDAAASLCADGKENS